MKNLKNTSKRNLSFNPLVWLVSFISSVLMLLIGSMNSPLYKINEWGDATTLFTVGRCIKHGRVLYRDVYEHKGFYYCFLHTIAAYISEYSYVGLYILEVISFTVFLYFVYKIWRLYTDDNCVIFLPVWALFVVSSLAFCQGDSVEEFCLPLFTYSLYVMLKYIKEKNLSSKTVSTWIMQGVLTGIVFWMKYVLCMYYIGICVFILIYFVKRKEIGEVVKIAAFWAVGLIASSIPAIVYFAVNNALSDLWHVYGYNLMFGYKPNKAGIGYVLLFIVLSLFVCILFLISGFIFKAMDIGSDEENLLFRILNVANIIYVLVFAWKEKYVLLCFMSVFAVWFLSYIKILDKVVDISKHFKKLLVIFTFAAVALTFIISVNTSSINKKRNSYVQYDFADIINKEEDKSLMVYRCQELGFYMTTKTIPTIKYINYYNIELDEINDTVDGYIKNKEVNFVITCEKKPDILLDNYDIVKEESYENLSEKKKYYLWKKK